jgi:hypothetical protein
MPEGRFTLLYDGECPFCRREVEWLRRRDREGHLVLEDIADPSFDPVQYGLTREEVVGVLHGILPDGRVVRRHRGHPASLSGGGTGLARRADAMAGRPLGARRYVRYVRAQPYSLGKLARQTVRERQMYDHARTTASGTNKVSPPERCLMVGLCQATRFGNRGTPCIASCLPVS